MGRCVFGVRSSSLARAMFALAFAAVGCMGEDTPAAKVAETSQPLWANGGFESDAVGSAPSSWTVTPNLNPQNTGVTLQTPQTLAGLNLAVGGTAAGRVVDATVPTGSGAGHDAIATEVTYPKFGNRSVVVNYIPAGEPGGPFAGNQRHVNTITQQMTVGSGDIDPDDGQVHVRFALAPVLGGITGHPQGQQPYYFIRLRNITKGTDLYNEINFSDGATQPWKTAGTGMTAVVYTYWQLIDIAPGSAALAQGDTVEIRIIAAGCSQTAHAGHVYIDGVGTTVPGLYVAATAATSANAGADLTYSLRYKNGGSADAANTTIEFVTPINTTFKSLMSSGTCTPPATGSAGTITCNVGTVAAAASGTLQVTVSIGAAASGTIVQNNYSARADGISRLLGTHTTTTITNPDLSVSLSSGLARVGWGQPVTYTIVASNTGSGPATVASLTDTLPAQLTGSSWTCSATNSGVCAASGTGSINDATLSLPAGAAATYLVHANVVSGSGTATLTYSATASVTSAGVDTNNANNTASEAIPIGPVRTLTVTKTAAGAVTSAPSGLSCMGTCSSASAMFADGTPLTLTATAPSLGTFTGWGGACASAGMATTCNFTISADQTVTAAFTAPSGSIATSAGDAQKTPVNTAFATNLDVLVLNTFGDPAPGVTVSFAVPGSGASATLNSATAVTDATGHAHVTATANGTPGAYLVSATAPGVATAAQFALSNLGPAASVTIVSGDAQSIHAGSSAQGPLVVEVHDAANQVLPGVTVTFTAPTMGATGALSSMSLVTDASGRASVTLTSGHITGAYSVTAAVGGVSTPATFMLTNTPGSATVIAVSAGNAQTATVGQAFATALDVLVSDSFGNASPNTAVSFSVPNSGASATLSAYGLVTDSNGHAVVTAAANSRAGAYSITASTTGASSAAMIALTNVAGPATNISALPANAQQSAKEQTAFAAPLLVVVSDAFGNPVAGSHVTYVTPSSEPNAALSGTSATTDSAGHASITATASSMPGAYIVTAKLDGNAGQTDFTLTNTAASLPAISVVAGSAASAQVGSAFATSLEVLVTLDGNPLPNTLVSFSGPTHGASATFATPSVMTDMAGHAQVVAMAGTIAGSYNVTASVPNALQAVSFALTNTPGAPTKISAAPAAGMQSAQIDTRFGADLSVIVLDAHDNPVPNSLVSFSVPSSAASATLDTATASSDANGRAHVAATANGGVGSYTVSANVTGVNSPALFLLSNVSGPPLSVVIVSGSPQSASVAAAFAQALTVKVTDPTGTPVSGKLVTFTTPSSGASAALSDTTATTDVNGTAQITATASHVAGAYEIVVSVDGGAASARFSLINTAGAAASIGIATGSTPQSARITTAFANALGVLVLDVYGNPVSGIVVGFTAPNADPSAQLTSSSPTTSATGEASVAAIALKKPGTYMVTAQVSGKPLTATFQLTNTNGDPASVVVTNGGAQTGLATQPFAKPIVVAVRDAQGNPVAGAKVAVSVNGAGPGATLSAQELTTDASGEASVSVTANDQPGDFTVSLTVMGAATSAVAKFTNTPIPTTINLTLSPTSGAVGDVVIVTVTLISSHGIPGGHVELLVDGESIDNVLLASGTATYTYTLSAADVGTHQVTATYDAQGTYGASQSDAVSLTVQASASDAGTAADGGGLIASDGGPATGTPLPVHSNWKVQGGGGCSLIQTPSPNHRWSALILLAGVFLYIRRARRK